MFGSLRKLSKAGIGPKNRRSFFVLQLVALALFVVGALLPWKTIGTGASAQNLTVFQLGQNGGIDLSGYCALAGAAILIVCMGWAVAGRSLERSYRWCLYLVSGLMVVGTGITVFLGTNANLSSQFGDILGQAIVWIAGALVYWSAHASRHVADRELDALDARAREHAREVALRRAQEAQSRSQLDY